MIIKEYLDSIDFTRQNVPKDIYDEVYINLVNYKIFISEERELSTTKCLSDDLKDARLQAEKFLESMDKVNERINKQSCQIKNQ